MLLVEDEFVASGLKWGQGGIESVVGGSVTGFNRVADQSPLESNVHEDVCY